jgi:hypothetical protein
MVTRDYVGGGGGPWINTVECASEKAPQPEETKRNSDAIIGLIGASAITRHYHFCIHRSIPF